MAQFSVTLAKIAEESNLTTLYAAKDLSETKVITAEVYRPGIMLAGYYQYFDRTRIQIIGLTELSYLQELDPEIRRTHLEKLFSFVPPAVILTRGLEPMPEMMEFAKSTGAAAALQRDDKPFDEQPDHNAEYRAGPAHHPPRRAG